MTFPLDAWSPSGWISASWTWADRGVELGTDAGRCSSAERPVLVAARAVQGLDSALTAPTALALTATMFPAGQARNRALALYGVMSGLGVTAGLLLGGVLTGMPGWRWGFFINIPIGLALLAGTRILVDAPRHTGRLDLPGAMTGTGGIAALVFAAIL
jgi:MFS family permease